MALEYSTARESELVAQVVRTEHHNLFVLSTNP